jgi:hypothetical protein
MTDFLGHQLVGGCIVYRFPRPKTVPRLASIVMPMGKYRGVPITSVVDHDPDYVGWLIGQDWFFQKYPRAGEYLVACISVQPGL